MKNNLRKVRKAQSKTTKEAAAAIGISEKYYRALERDLDKGNITILLAACDYYHTSSDYLMGRTQHCT